MKHFAIHSILQKRSTSSQLLSIWLTLTCNNQKKTLKFPWCDKLPHMFLGLSELSASMRKRMFQIFQALMVKVQQTWKMQSHHWWMPCPPIVIRSNWTPIKVQKISSNSATNSVTTFFPSLEFCSKIENLLNLLFGSLLPKRHLLRNAKTSCRLSLRKSRRKKRKPNAQLS